LWPEPTGLFCTDLPLCDNCTHMATVGVIGLNGSKHMEWTL